MDWKPKYKIGEKVLVKGKYTPFIDIITEIKQVDNFYPDLAFKYKFKYGLWYDQVDIAGVKDNKIEYHNKIEYQ